MTRAMVAIAKAQFASMLDRLKLSDDEVMQVGLALAISRAGRAGADGQRLHALLDDALTAVGVEGLRGARDASQQ